MESFKDWLTVAWAQGGSLVGQQLHSDALDPDTAPGDSNFDPSRARCSRAASLAVGGPGERGLLSLLRPAAPARRHSSHAPGYCPPAPGPAHGPGPASFNTQHFKYCPSDALPYCPPSRPPCTKAQVTQRPPPPIPQRAPAVPKRNTPPQQAPVVPPLPRRSSPQPPPTRIPPPPPPPPPARHIPPPDKNSHLYTMYPGKPPTRTRDIQPRKQPNQEQTAFNYTDACTNNLMNNTEQDHNQNAPKPHQPASHKKIQNITKNPVQDVNMNPSKKMGNVPPPLTSVQNINQNAAGGVPKVSLRQDSSVSSDSFSQTSSPSYTTKTMEAPLLPHHYSGKSGRLGGRLMPTPPVPPTTDEGEGSSPLTKSASTPASLQTIVRFHNGSNMSLHHKIIRDMRRSSNTYVTQGRFKFRSAQVLVNAVALLAIAGGLAAYFRAYPAIQVVNKTITTNTIMAVSPASRNPAPGICLPVIVNFCQYHRVPYNYTLFPNYLGNFGQRDAQHELEVFDALVDVRCYELAALFLCSVFVPKCGPLGSMVRPCRSLCYETIRRCGFFLGVFGLSIPEYLHCNVFPESMDPDVCIGYKEVREARQRAQKPVCPTGFQCDTKRCIPADWRCDGHVDCLDQSDELNCKSCGRGTIHCGERRCMSQSHVCDGKIDCPWGQDERNCLRLSESNGDIARGQLQLFRPQEQKWQPACVSHWDAINSPTTICSMLGYSTVNSSRLTTQDGNELTVPARQRDPSLWRMYQVRDTNLLKEFRTCGATSSNVDLICTNYVCGKRRQVNAKPAKRIVGGVEAAPGDWPFLAAILGGPEEVFYCAGVLIADQWVLTASHCVGNHSDVSGWTIQLGITRRHAHSYYGQKMKVKRVIPHPQYNVGAAHDNDVALLQLASRVTFHEQLVPVCLPPANRELPEGTYCTVIGWGKREDRDMSEYEPAVNEVQVPVLNRQLCNSWLEHKDLNVTEGMICAGYPEGGKDACQGDSGGPLLCRDPIDKERWYVGGIVSWGIKCAHPRLPGVYAFVPKYVNWIKQQLETHSERHMATTTSSVTESVTTTPGVANTTDINDSIAM